ncbi:RBM43 protein, partial [Turnix velox]|nr:RBM43 protein [Turnix velox]
VFSSVTSVLNISLFQDQFVLEDLVEELKKESRALSFGPLQPNGHISVQGSFPAIKLLRDFLLKKAKSLAEKDKGEEMKSCERRRLQQHRLTTETSHFGRDADGKEQAVVVDTDIYHYMKYFYPKTFLGDDGVVISGVTDGDITTVYIRDADAERVLRVKEKIKTRSHKLLNALCKERINLEGQSGGEKQWYKQVCESLKPHYPLILVIPYDTHLDVIGSPSEIFGFLKEVSS